MPCLSMSLLSLLQKIADYLCQHSKKPIWRSLLAFPLLHEELREHEIDLDEAVKLFLVRALLLHFTSRILTPSHQVKSALQLRIDVQNLHVNSQMQHESQVTELCALRDSVRTLHEIVASNLGEESNAGTLKGSCNTCGCIKQHDSGAETMVSAVGSHRAQNATEA